MRTQRRGATWGMIDVGTNSIHLMIGRVDRHGRFRALVKERTLTRLGEGGLVSDTLTPTAMRRAIRVLRRYAATLKRYAVDHIEAVATSAVREAANGRKFVRHVRQTLGLPLRIISGREEARLIYRGGIAANRLRASTVIVSIGGGSTQVMVGRGAVIQFATSLSLGSARLAQQFIHHDPPRRQELDALERAVRRMLAPVARAVRRYRWQRVLGCSAMIEQVIAAAQRHPAHPRPKPTQPLAVSQHSLRRLVQWLSTSTASQRKRVPGLDPKRQDLALTTGVSLLTWMEQCGISSIRYAPGSLREGLVMGDTRGSCGVNKEHRR